MGVLGLWQIIDSVGHPIKLEGLEGKQLGVDANLWLYKFIRGFRDKDNATNLDAHKLGLFNRISKLLFYKIKPIFVFDGPAPVLKRRTLERRKDIRNKEYSRVQSSAIKLLSEQLKAQYPGVDIEQLRINLPNLRSHNLVLAEKLTDEDRELFYLPPEDKDVIQEESDFDDDEDYFSIPSQIIQQSTSATKISNDTVYIIDSDEEYEDDYSNKDVKPVIIKHESNIDISSKEFDSLPAEIRYEMLQEIKEEKRRIKRVTAMPEDAETFSNFQLNRLKSKRFIQEKIEKCEKDIQYNYTGEIAGNSIQSYRVQSDATLTMLYGKKIPPNNQSNDVKPQIERETPNASEFEVVKKTKTMSESSSKMNDEQINEPARLSPDPFKGRTVQAKTTNLITPRSIEVIPRKLIIADKSFDEHKEPQLSPREDEDEAQENDTEDDYLSVPSQLTQDLTKQSTSTQKVSNDTVYITDSDDEHDKNVCLTKTTESSIHIDDTDSESGTDFQEVEAPPSASSNNEPVEVLQEIVGDDMRSRSPVDSQKCAKTPSSSSQSAKLYSAKPLSQENNQQKCDTVETIELCNQTDDDRIIQEKNNDIDSRIPVEVLPSKSIESEPIVAISSEEPMILNSQKDTPQENEKQDQEETVAKESVAKIRNTETNQIAFEVAKTSRVAAKVTTKIIEEAKELLKLFGVPYIDAPGEAEAQLALLEQLKLTEGTVTDDSDVWLFGAQNVYRHFFSDDKYVLQYKMSEIDFHIRMNRTNLICFAMLVGSDYTDGIMNVGPVTALEILSEFPGDEIEPLIKFKNWRDQYNKTKRGRIPGSKKRETFLKLNLPEGFPSRTVFEGYMKPAADLSTEKFQWGTPELDELREYARRNFGWDIKKIDEKLLPVMKKVNERKTQPTIDSFFFKRAATQNPELFRSKRINQALNKIQETKSSGSQEKQGTVVLTESEESSDGDVEQDKRISDKKDSQKKKSKSSQVKSNRIRKPQNRRSKVSQPDTTNTSASTTKNKETKRRRVKK